MWTMFYRPICFNGDLFSHMNSLFLIRIIKDQSFKLFYLSPWYLLFTETILKVILKGVEDCRGPNLSITNYAPFLDI